MTPLLGLLVRALEVAVWDDPGTPAEAWGLKVRTGSGWHDIDPAELDRLVDAGYVAPLPNDHIAVTRAGRRAWAKGVRG